MSDLYNLLESESISDKLKVEMLYRIAENLGEEITEEEISELDKTFNLFGHTIDIKKQNKTPDAFDIAQEIHKKPASEPETTEASKTEATKRSIRAPKVIGLLKRSRDTREAALKKYGRKNKVEEAPKVEATEAPKAEEVKDNVIKGNFSKPQAKDSYAKTVQYMSSDNKNEAPKAEVEAEPKAEKAPKSSKKTSTKIGKAIGKAVSKKAGNVINNEVTTVKAPKGSKKK